MYQAHDSTCKALTQSAELTIDGASLSVAELHRVLAAGDGIKLSSAAAEGMLSSIDILEQKLAAGRVVYGVNTLFGGMANEKVEDTDTVQHILVASHNAGIGDNLPTEDVKTAMVLRVNALAKGVSAIRPVVLERYLALINRDIIPVVKDRGSIGASGDLVPLATIAGAALGLSDDFQLWFEGNIHGAKTLLAQLGFSPISLRAKEGLALMNGTSVLTAIAVQNLNKLVGLFETYLSFQGLMCELLEADTTAFSDFIQKQRPHRGQIWVARSLRQLLKGATLTRDREQIEQAFSEAGLIQDRYSIRCMPQFIGPTAEFIEQATRTINIEINSATDNPLIDTESADFYHGGNFLGQHITHLMDQMRVHLALMAKHNDAQIASLVEPQFSGGLPQSLAMQGKDNLSVGVKPLQIVSNSLVPLLEQKSSPLSVHFPIHAEQFNQNLNSQGFGSALLTRESIELFEQQLAVSALIMTHAALVKAGIANTSFKATYTESSVALLEQTLTIIGENEHDLTSGVVHSGTAGKYRGWLERISAHLATNGYKTSVSFPRNESLSPSR